MSIHVSKLAGALITTAIALQETNSSFASETVMWKEHCTIAGIDVDEHSDAGKLIREFAQRCSPTDACVLACMRNQCDAGAGGCFHDCGGRSAYGPPEVLAEMYANKDKRLCPIDGT